MRWNNHAKLPVQPASPLPFFEPVDTEFILYTHTHIQSDIHTHSSAVLFPHVRGHRAQLALNPVAV